MHTRPSRRTSPLLHDPKIEKKTVRSNRKATKYSSEVTCQMTKTNQTHHHEVWILTTNKNFEDPSPIVYPVAANETTTNFKIQPNLIAILPTFRGRTNEEPYTHLHEFFSITHTDEVTSMTKDGVRLRLFPFSLKDQAKEWFSSLEPRSINSWAKMQSKILDEFYSISKSGDIRSRIKSFRQLLGEQFHEAFNRLKKLLRTCPHHDVPKWELVKVFYDGLDCNNQQFVVATSGGVFFSRPMEEEWDFFEKLSKGSRT
ncbi:DNA-directed DNA polymerase [Tanacetum coccineum]